MDTFRGLIPHPLLGAPHRLQAGSSRLAEKPVLNPFAFLGPRVSEKVFPAMLALLETLRNQVVSGYEPASFLITLSYSGRILITGVGEPPPWSPAAAVFRVAAKSAAGGCWLEVEHAADRTGYRLEQFCRKLPGGRWEALPYRWSRSGASSAYPRTPGLTL
jgi:hypothetical protein